MLAKHSLPKEITNGSLGYALLFGLYLSCAALAPSPVERLQAQWLTVPGPLVVVGFELKISFRAFREERWGIPAQSRLSHAGSPLRSCCSLAGDMVLRNAFGKYRHAYLLYREEILPTVRKLMQHPFRIEIISIVRD